MSTESNHRGMSARQYRRRREQIILQILSKGELQSTEISRRLKTDYSNTVAALERMADRGLLERKARVTYGKKRKRIFWRVK